MKQRPVKRNPLRHHLTLPLKASAVREAIGEKVRPAGAAKPRGQRAEHEQELNNVRGGGEYCVHVYALFIVQCIIHCIIKSRT